MEGICLSEKQREIELDPTNCVICQLSTADAVTSTENGRKRIRMAAEQRDDVVCKRLKRIGEQNFVYHMSNACYKNYTHKRLLEIVNRSEPIEDPAQSATRTRQQAHREAAARPQPSQKPDIYKHKCVICNQIKVKNICEKFRLSESPRAEKFLKATVHYQDDIYTRTCDIQDVSSVFGADLYCHKICIKNYLLKYDRSQIIEVADALNDKKRAWNTVSSAIKLGFSKGEGFELSYIRDHINAILGSPNMMRNNEVKVLLMNEFGDNICFSYPKQKNKSLMCFSKSFTTADMAETIRSADSIKECATLIRKELMAINFGLEDKFCDAEDLETAWKNMSIPEPLLSFFAILFNFDKDSFVNETSNDGTYCSEEDEQEYDNSSPDKGKGKPSASKCRQIHALFQVMFYDLHCGRKRTPLHMMNSQVIHETCKSATLIKSFNRFGLCSSYDEVLRVQNDMANFAAEISKDGVPFPLHFDKNKFTVAAFDNFDHNEVTLSGIGSCHDTVTVLFQEKSGSSKQKPNVSETEVLHGSRSFSRKLECQNLQEFYKPAKKPDLPPGYTVEEQVPILDGDLVKQTYLKDVAWALSRLEIRENNDDSPPNAKPESQSMPSWSASNSVMTTETIPVMQVAFLPVIPYPVTEYQTVYTAMKNLVDIHSQLGQSHLAIFCDEGVYHIAREIQLMRTTEFKDVILCLGSFHMAKVLLGCIGKYLKGSGAESIWVESGVFGVNVVESVLNGKNYVRSVKGMQLLGEAMRRLQWIEFFKSYGIEEYSEVFEVVSQFKTAVSQKNQEESQEAVAMFAKKSRGLLNDFQKFVQEYRSENETFKYWDTFLCLLTLLNNLIRSDREGNWELHLQTVQDMLPLFAAMDSSNYLRWCSLYLEDMRKLPLTAPEMHQKFLQGGFVVKRTAGRFKAVGVDMSLEQTINRSQKSSAGIIGSTRKKNFIAKWEMVYHEMLAISNLHRRLACINSKSYELSVNHEFSQRRTIAEEKHVQALASFIESNKNPFDTSCEENRLHNILTQEIMTEEIRGQLLKVQEIGAKKYNDFRQERLVKKTLRLHDTIHRTNLKSFIHIRSSGNDKKKCSTKKKRESALQQRSVDIARARGTAMEDMLEYDVTSVPSLFTEDEMMKKSTKSDLLRELEKHLPEDEANCLCETTQ